jgi:hypothetical protein
VAQPPQQVVAMLAGELPAKLGALPRDLELGFQL